MNDRQYTGSPATRLSPSADLIIQAEQVTKAYQTTKDPVPVLRGVDLEIRKGERVAVMGPSGCGKTTLINCLSGLDRPDRGKILFEGIDLTRANDRIRTRLRVERMGFVFQAYNLIPVLPVLANVRLHLELNGVPRKQAERQARDALTAVGLEGLAGRRPTELSGGQQQRVAIARALVNDPAVVWADEPTGNLDSHTGAQILDLFGGLSRDHGTTFVIVTHDPAVASVADRTIRMDSGRILRAGEV